ncbi:uncharacterized protein LOC123225505 isoform X2 [Mangifera indica]|uniref:uncharacterized protein LOC123225505 isoform X2 n=1 Tax=Mangifera indica TaxID=29780 RepID=UPI001CFBBDC4|nr:uncharacterized protein LOC123225505 isoform X2 [Mangifera indica]
MMVCNWCSCCCSCSCSSFTLLLRNEFRFFLRDYDRLQYIAVILIYIQIGCALIGSLAASYNGVLLINLGIALFALVAIESSSQSLGRTYAVLLFCAILLDIFWFILFSHEVWNMSSKDYGVYFIFSVKLALAMQIVGFTVRLSSSFLWIQMYRLGVSYVDRGGGAREPDFDLRNSFLSPVTPAGVAAVNRQHSVSDDVLGGSIYDPAYYSSLFEDSQQSKNLFAGNNDGTGDQESTSSTDASQTKGSMGRSFQTIDDKRLAQNLSHGDFITSICLLLLPILPLSLQPCFTTVWDI